MLLSELISRLEELKAKHGDLPVYKDPKCDESYWLEAIDFVDAMPVHLDKPDKYGSSRDILFYCEKDDSRGAPNALEVSI